jgi:hypothetical protein
LHRELENRARARGLDAVDARREVVAGHGPAVAPEQRPDVEHADAAAIEIGFVVQRKFLDVILDEQSEVAGTDVSPARGGEQLAAALDHVDTHVVEVRARDLARTSHADVVGRVRALTTGSVRDE